MKSIGEIAKEYSNGMYPDVYLQPNHSYTQEEMRNLVKHIYSDGYVDGMTRKGMFDEGERTCQQQ